MSLPSYTIRIVPIQAKTPKVGAPMTQEQYDQWIADEDHIRFEEKCDAGKVYFWAAMVTENIPDGLDQSKELHSLPFDLDANTGATRLKDFMGDIARLLRDKAKHTMGDDETRIIRP